MRTLDCGQQQFRKFLRIDFSRVVKIMKMTQRFANDLAAIRVPPSSNFGRNELLQVLCQRHLHLLSIACLITLATAALIHLPQIRRQDV